jgi:diguanylate cyclase (GGDEF)-like protein
MLYLLVIILFHRFLQPMYQSVVENWPIFSILVLCIFLNLSYYFYATKNIKDTLATNKWPMLLLVGLSIVAYGTVFYSMKKFLTMHALEIENMKIQKETGRLYEAALQMEKHANYDMLTGLPNRRYFFERLEHIVKLSQGMQTFAVFYIDLDGFKSINDTFGHQLGDKVLVEVGNRLSNCIRETDFVARLGGDEFAVITSNVESQTKIEQFAKRVHSVLQESIDIDTRTCSVNASIGVAIYPDAGSDSETLLRSADAAMYEVKRNGKGGAKIAAVK